MADGRTSSSIRPIGNRIRSPHAVAIRFSSHFRVGFAKVDSIAQATASNCRSPNRPVSTPIHGFTPRNPWRVLESRGEGEFASITGAFANSDIPAGGGHWPGEFELQVTYTLSHDRLRVTANIFNGGSVPLPFGLGYHPYFRLPGWHQPTIDECRLTANVDRLWETAVDGLPTGKRLEIPSNLDFHKPKPIGETTLDHAFSIAPELKSNDAGLNELALLSHPEAAGRLRILGSASFRELVLFTPAHRHAIAIEPYTCSADAANLETQGIDAGWRELAVGASWLGDVEYVWEPLEI